MTARKVVVLGILLSLLIFAAGCGGSVTPTLPPEETIPPAIELFGGEFVVKPDGIYTFAHYYEHPETGHKIIIIGMNHGGDEEYFKQVAGILEEADLVLYEVTRGQPKDPTVVEMQRATDLIKMLSDDLDEAFPAAMGLYFESATEYLQLAQEQDLLTALSGWEPGDIEFWLRTTEEEFDAAYQKGLAGLTPDRKRAVVEYVKDALWRMENKEFTKKDFGDGFVFFYSDQATVDMLLGVLGNPRDEEVFGRFDQLVEERDPQVVAIKFGAAHTANQRRLLEQRGYIHVRTVELRNLAF